MGKWQLDPYHTQIEFSAKHLGMMTVRGHFTDVTPRRHRPGRSGAVGGRGDDPDGQHPDQPRSTGQRSALLQLHRRRDLSTATFKSTAIKQTGHGRIQCYRRSDHQGRHEAGDARGDPARRVQRSRDGTPHRLQRRRRSNARTSECRSTRSWTAGSSSAKVRHELSFSPGAAWRTVVGTDRREATGGSALV